jgi:hypothetical protein
MTHSSTVTAGLLPCPLCRSINVTEGVCYVDGLNTKEPAVRCVDCGCRATLKAWHSRRPAQGSLNCDNCGRAFLPDDTVFASVNHGVRRTVHLKCPDAQGGCICQEQHRRGYCTEPGCPYANQSAQGHPHLAVDAWQWMGGDLKEGDPDWVAEATEPGSSMLAPMVLTGGLDVWTARGKQRAKSRDWIVRADGEICLFSEAAWSALRGTTALPSTNG